MIIELLITIAVMLAGLLFSALGNLPAPGFLTGLSDQLASLVAMGAGLGVWIPWPVVGAVFAAVVGCLSVSLAVRVIRIVVSLFTGGGGSAG